MLKKLCMLDGVSGNEHEVRDFILENIKPFATDVTVDRMGNIIAKKDIGAKKTVALFAHMDEVGFIVKSVTGEGYLKFDMAGGVSAEILPSQQVKVGESKINGVIGIKAVHLVSASERKTPVKIKDMYIDIGAKDKAEALEYVRVGDYVAFDSDYVEFGDSFIKAKALDDRVGCAIIMDIMKRNLPVNLVCVFTTQEEEGLRGAKAAAFATEADFALVIETTTASDVYPSQKNAHVASLGAGPVITVMDRTTYSSKEIRSSLCEFCDKNGIKYQLKRGVFGGNDAGAVHLSKDGIKTCAVSVACRYLHSPTTVMAEADYVAAKELVEKYLMSL